MRHLFDTWTEQSAYIFGFWFADGSIYLEKRGKQYYKRFAICNTDEQIIKRIANILKGSLSLYVKKGGNCKPCYYFRKYSEQLFDFCYNITGTTQKSKQSNLPNIPASVFRHFVRGFFDGDGSIHLTTYKNRHKKETTELRTSFTAGNDTGDFLIKLRDAIRAYIPIGKRKSVGKKTKKIAFGQYDSALLCEWMYDGATIFMKRKRDIWDSSDKKKLLESKRYFSNKV
jgi:hypothetical protein